MVLKEADLGSRIGTQKIMWHYLRIFVADCSSLVLVKVRSLKFCKLGPNLLKPDQLTWPKVVISKSTIGIDAWPMRQWLPGTQRVKPNLLTRVDFWKLQISCVASCVEWAMVHLSHFDSMVNLLNKECPCHLGRMFKWFKMASNLSFFCF